MATNLNQLGNSFFKDVDDSGFNTGSAGVNPERPVQNTPVSVTPEGTSSPLADYVSTGSVSQPTETYRANPVYGGGTYAVGEGPLLSASQSPEIDNSEVWWRYRNLPIFQQPGWKAQGRSSNQNRSYVNTITGQTLSAQGAYEEYAKSPRGIENAAYKAKEKKDKEEYTAYRTSTPYGDFSNFNQKQLNEALSDPEWGSTIRDIINDPRGTPKSLMAYQNSVTYPQLNQAATLPLKVQRYDNRGALSPLANSGLDAQGVRDLNSGLNSLTPEQWNYISELPPENNLEGISPELSSFAGSGLSAQDITDLNTGLNDLTYNDTTDFIRESSDIFWSPERGGARAQQLEKLLSTSRFQQAYTEGLRADPNTNPQEFFNSIHTMFYYSPEEFALWRNNPDNIDMAIRFHAMAATGEFGPANKSGDEEWDSKKHQQFADTLGFKLSQDLGWGEDGKQDGSMIATNYDGKISKDVNNPKSGGDFWKIGTPEKITDGVRNWVVDNPVESAIIVAALAFAPQVIGTLSAAGTTGTGLTGVVLSAGVAPAFAPMAAAGLYAAGTQLATGLASGEDLDADLLLNAVKTGAISALTFGAVQWGAGELSSLTNGAISVEAGYRITGVALETAKNGGDVVSAVIQAGLAEGVNLARGAATNFVGGLSLASAETTDMPEGFGPAAGMPTMTEEIASVGAGLPTSTLEDLDIFTDYSPDSPVLPSSPAVFDDPKQQLIVDLGNGTSGYSTPDGFVELPPSNTTLDDLDIFSDTTDTIDLPAPIETRDYSGSINAEDTSNMSYDEFESFSDKLADSGFPLTDTDGEYLAPDENYTLKNGDEYWTRTTEVQPETSFNETANENFTGDQGTQGQGTQGQGTQGQGTQGQGTGGQGTGGVSNADWQQTLDGIEDAGLPTVDSTGNPLKNDGTVYDLNSDNQWVKMGPTGGQGLTYADGTPMELSPITVGSGTPTEANSLFTVDGSGNQDSTGLYAQNGKGQYSAAPLNTSGGTTTYPSGTSPKATQPVTLRIDGKDTVTIGGFQQTVKPDTKIVAWFLNEMGNPNALEEVIVTASKPEGLEFRFPDGSNLWTISSLADWIDMTYEGQIPKDVVWDDNAPTQEDDEETEPTLEEVKVTADSITPEDPQNIPINIPTPTLTNPELNPNGQPMDNIVVTAPTVPPTTPDPITVTTPVVNTIINGLDGTDGTDGSSGGRGETGARGPASADSGWDTENVPLMKRIRLSYPSPAEQQRMFQALRARQQQSGKSK